MMTFNFLFFIFSVVLIGITTYYLTQKFNGKPPRKSIWERIKSFFKGHLVLPLLYLRYRFSPKCFINMLCRILALILVLALVLVLSPLIYKILISLLLWAIFNIVNTIMIVLKPFIVMLGFLGHAVHEDLDLLEGPIKNRWCPEVDVRLISFSEQNSPTGQNNPDKLEEYSSTAPNPEVEKNNTTENKQERRTRYWDWLSSIESKELYEEVLKQLEWDKKAESKGWPRKISEISTSDPSSWEVNTRWDTNKEDIKGVKVRGWAHYDPQNPELTNNLEPRARSSANRGQEPKPESSINNPKD